MCSLLCLLCLVFIDTTAVPIQFLPSPMMPQMPQAVQSPLPLLQEQLMELQAMQQVDPIAPVTMRHMQPLIVILPGAQVKLNTENNLNNKITEVHNEDRQKGDEDTVIIDAEPMQPIPTLESNEKAIVMLPGGRLFLNSIISSIPWLPIEINVPDTIVWMYNGISSIISAIQQSSQQTTQGSRLKYKSYDTNFRNENFKPIVVIPIQI